MKTWKITSRDGMDMGTYVSDDEAGALDAMARDAGYADHSASCVVAPVAGGDLVVTDALTQGEDDGGETIEVSYDSDAAMATARSGRIWACCEALETTGEPVWSYSSLRDEGDPIMDDLREAALEEMRDRWEYDGSSWSRPRELTVLDVDESESEKV